MTYFDDLNGKGQSMKCRLCGVSTWFINYINGREESGESFPYYGFQCQTCGKIEVGEARAIETDKKCSCGGVFRRDKPLLMMSFNVKPHLVSFI